MDLRAAHAFRPFGRLGAQRAAVATMVAALLAAVCPALAACGRSDGTATVADVDDRLDLVLADGRTVRLGGVATPDAARSPDLAQAARSFLVHRFVGRDGEIERLASGTDRWGRLVADLTFLDSTSGGRQDSAASALLGAGLARVVPNFEARACVPERLRIEDAARSGKLGLWVDPRYAVIDSADAEALRNSDGRFVVVEGKVRRVGFGRSRLYLDLVSKGGLTIVLPRKLEPALARAGFSVGAAAGQTVRARGALDTRLGPRLEVSEPAMVEFLGRSDAPGADTPLP